MGIEILQRGINRAANHARAEGADRLVDWHNAAHLGGIDSAGAEQFDLRIHHFTARGTKLIDLHFAVKNDLLPGLQPPFQVATVKKLAGKRAGLILNQEVINGIAAVPTADGLAAHDPRTESVYPAGLKVFNFGKMNAVFVTERQIVEQIFEGEDATLGEKLRALRPDSLHHANFRWQTDGHVSSLYHPLCKLCFS